MRGSSSQQQQQREELAVYDFDAGEEAVEAASGKYAARFQSKHQRANAGGGEYELTKYSFLRAFQSGSQMKQTDVTGVLCIDLHERNHIPQSYATESPEANRASSDERTEFDVVMATSTSYNDHNHAYVDAFEPTRMMTKGQSAVEVRFDSGQLFELQTHGIVADSEEGSWSSSPQSSSTTNCDVPGYMEQKMQYGCCTAFEETIDEDGPVILHPEFVMCNTALHMEPQLTFSSDFFKIECSDSDACGDYEGITMEWDISEIIHIDCKWTESVASAVLRLLVQSNAENGKGDPVRVQFTLTDGHWLKKEQRILNLSSRYREIWNTIPLDDLVSESWSIEPSLFFPKQYFTETLAPFEDVIYPKGDPDAVSISKRDVDMLLPETFVNDTIIDFYIKYLSNRIQPSEKQRYHFFNSFFFRKLADLDKDQGKALEGRAAFLRVRKWTRKVSLFEKDFVFIPVNFNLHWSLVVICHPGEVATFEDSNIRESPKVPCILHMDSLKGSHNGLKDIIRSYLWEEWKERQPESASDNSEKFLKLRFVSLELPQQDNSFDCGLFLLHYVELFLVDAPSSFNPLQIDEFSSFLSDDWFPPAEASLKRSVIRKLIYELLNEPCQNVPTATCSNEHRNGGCHRSDDVEQEPGIEFLAQRCSAGELDSVCAVRDGGVEMQPLSTSVCLDDSGEKAEPTSGCNLEIGRVSVASLENLAHTLDELEECVDKDKVVCSSSQDEEENERPCTNSDNQLGSSLCAPEDGGAFDTSGCMVEEDSHEDSSLVCLDDSQKVSSQAEETRVQDVMDEKCCSVSENLTISSAEEVIVCEEGSPERNTGKVEDERCEAAQHVDTMVDDVRKDAKEAKIAVDGLDDSEQPISTECKEGNADDCMEVGSTKADDKAPADCPDVGDTVVKVGDVPCQNTTCCEAKRPLPDSTCNEKDIIISDDECPSNKHNVRGTDTKTEQQHYKRRKVVTPEGEKRRTRSSMRGSSLI